MPGPLGIREPRTKSKPSRLYGTDFWFIDGPHDGKMGKYQGKRMQVRIKAGPRQAVGEYVHQTRNVGKGLGYEHYYQWFGVTPEMLANG